MRYIFLTDEQTCRDLSRALWRLSRPEPVAEADGDQTLYLFGWRKHPQRNDWALRFDEQYQYPRHPDVPMMLTVPGDPYGSQALMQSLFLPIAADGVNSLQALTQYILTHDVIDTAQVLPHVNPTIVKTRAEMDADGWFPIPEM